MTVYIKSGIIEVDDKSIKFFHEMRSSETDDIVSITFLQIFTLIPKRENLVLKRAIELITIEIPKP